MKIIYEIFGYVTLISAKFADKQIYIIKRMKSLIDNPDDYNFKGGSRTMLYKR